MNSMTLIASNVQKIYKNGAKEVRAVDGITLELKSGESVAIVGPSGAGKSTLLHLLGGLDSPTSGSVALDGTDIYKLPDSRRARIRNSRIGLVFQFYHLLPEFTALENVMMPFLIKGQGSRVKGQGKAIALLKSVGLSDRMNHKPGELSGGEAQRVAIARALMNEPEFLLCDEPTGNLDSKTSDSVLELLFDLKSKSKATLVIVTHNEAVSQLTNRTIHIKDGRVSI